MRRKLDCYHHRERSATMLDCSVSVFFLLSQQSFNRCTHTHTIFVFLGGYKKREHAPSLHPFVCLSLDLNKLSSLHEKRARCRECSDSSQRNLQQQPRPICIESVKFILWCAIRIAEEKQREKCNFNYRIRDAEIVLMKHKPNCSALRDTRYASRFMCHWAYNSDKFWQLLFAQCVFSSGTSPPGWGTRKKIIYTFTTIDWSHIQLFYSNYETKEQPIPVSSRLHHKLFICTPRSTLLVHSLWSLLA